MDLRALFRDHVTAVARDAEGALAQAHDAGRPHDGIVFHAGVQTYYHADDRAIDFRPTPHFARWVPVAGPDHLLLFRPGTTPRLLRVIPRDYWYEPPADVDHPYAEVLDTEIAATPEEARARLGDVSRCAFVGSDHETARALGIERAGIEPAPILARLDWARAFKTPYEVTCLREAVRRAAHGHRAVRLGVPEALPERVLHAAYLESAEMLEPDSPYTNIIAWDDRTAILHYQTKRTTHPDPGNVLLVDAGAMHHGYASDVTRTYVRDGVHPAFREALDRMDALQRDLVRGVRPRQSFVELHEMAHRGVAAILRAIGVLRRSPEEAFARGLTRPFLPHGLGHHLGLQVHDVGGRQLSPAGERRDPPSHYPYLRTTRDLAPGHVVTIEPGLYFIPMLLEPYRASKEAALFDWSLVDALVPCGGIRVEDDVLVTAEGHEDLTRTLVPGHLGI